MRSIDGDVDPRRGAAEPLDHLEVGGHRSLRDLGDHQSGLEAHDPIAEVLHGTVLSASFYGEDLHALALEVGSGAPDEVRERNVAVGVSIGEVGKSAAGPDTGPLG